MKELFLSRGPSPVPGGKADGQLGLVIHTYLSWRKTVFLSLHILRFSPERFLLGLSKLSRIQYRKQDFLWQLVRIIEMWVEAH